MILALDPSLSCIGWAVLEPDASRVVEYGTYKPQGKTLDEKLNTAFVWMLFRLERDFHEIVSVIAFEMPVVHRNTATTIKLAQLVGVLRTAAFRWISETIEINPGGRLATLGLPVAMKRPMAKQAVLANVNGRYGLKLKAREHDIADAIAVGIAASKRIGKASSWRFGRESFKESTRKGRNRGWMQAQEAGN